MSTVALKPQGPKDEANIRALVESIHKAHHDKDAAAIVASYVRMADRPRAHVRALLHGWQLAASL